jgi:uncharacterized protein YjdB
VKPPPATNPLARLVAIKAGQKSLTLVKGQKLKVAAFGYRADGTTAKVTWKSSAAKKVKVNKNGVIRGVKAGKATVTVSVGTFKTTIKVTVVSAKTKAKVTKVNVSAATAMKVGQSGPVKATFKSTAAAKAKVTYTSSNKAVLSVDTAGWAKALAPGQAVITVKVGSKSKKVTVTVS